MENEEITIGDEWLEWDSATNMLQDSPAQWDQIIVADDCLCAEKSGFAQNDGQANWFEAVG